MAYREAFWVALTAAAPVVGLAHAVLVGRNTARAEGIARHRAQLAELVAAMVGHARAEVVRLEAEVADRRAMWSQMFGGTDVELDARVAASNTGANLAAARVKLVEEETGSAEFAEQRRAARRSALLLIAADWIAFASWALCSVAMALGLLGLAEERDPAPVIVGALAIMLPMAAMPTGPVMDHWAARWFRDLHVPWENES